MGLRFFVFGVFSACPRRAWPDLGSNVLAFGCLPGLSSAFVASPRASHGWLLASSRLVVGVCGQSRGSKILGCRCLPGMPPAFVASPRASNGWLLASSRRAPGNRCQTLGSKILWFRCLLGVCGGRCMPPARNKEDPKTSHLRHRVQDTTEHRLIKAQSWP